MKNGRREIMMMQYEKWIGDGQVILWAIVNSLHLDEVWDGSDILNGGF